VFSGWYARREVPRSAEKRCTANLCYCGTQAGAEFSRAMFLRHKIRWKDGKEHYYFSVVDNKRVAGGRVVQRHGLTSYR
jgi:hypothetical protein